MRYCDNCGQPMEVNCHHADLPGKIRDGVGISASITIAGPVDICYECINRAAGAALMAALKGFETLRLNKALARAEDKKGGSPEAADLSCSSEG